MQTTLNLNDQAPDFNINLEDGKTTLTELLKENNVLVNFIPFAFTGVCEGEVCEVRDNFANYSTNNTTVVTVSCDAQPSINAWKKSLNIDYIFTSDFFPHGEISKQYGVFNYELGCANRYSFLVKKDGKVAAIVKSDELGTAREFEEIQKAIANI